MRRGLTKWGIVAFALIALAAAACSGDTTVNTQPGGEGISVSGTGRVTVQPDIAMLNLGVEVTADTVARARSGASETMQDIRSSLSGNGVEEKDITTLYFNIYPQYNYNEGKSQPEITGFTVSNQLQVKVRDIDRVSEILDGAIQAGGDAIRVNGISFDVDEPEQYYEQARKLAMEDAQAKAAQLADLAGVDLGDAKTISESTGGVTPRGFDEAVAAPATGGGTTPISPGEGEIVLTVSVIYDTN